ncbi:MAG: GNAT family N-acetyltransferase [Lacisediminihabitans sp.]
MLYCSIHVPEGSAIPARTILQQPEIEHYLKDFGSRGGDDAQVALTDDGIQIGAAWCRRMEQSDPGYGFVDEDIPELGMAVDASVRGRGIGRALLLCLLDRHPIMSLSVDNDNQWAIYLYGSLGFVTYSDSGSNSTMIRR